MHIVVLELEILIANKLPRKVPSLGYTTVVVCEGSLRDYHLPSEQTPPELLTLVKSVSTNLKVTQMSLS